MNKKSGFTSAELLISIAIIVILSAIIISSFYSARSSKTLDVITDGLVSTLEAARADSVAGKGSGTYGVEFDSGAYNYFVGSTYSAGSATNKISNLPSGWTLSTSTADGSSQIIFSRLSGDPQTTATVTVSNMNTPSLTRSITIGSSGDITVVK